MIMIREKMPLVLARREIPATGPSRPDFTLNTARALFDGDAYREMVSLVARAQTSVRLEFFLFGGPVADAMIGVLKAKQAEGVKVAVTLDRARGILPQVRQECALTYRRLRAEGFDVALSDPRPLPDAPARRPAVNHNKILVIDDREALVGGMNIGRLFFRHHDVMIHLTGPAAAALGQQFDYDRRFVFDPRVARPKGSLPLPPFAEALAEAREHSQNLALSGSDGAATWARILGTGVGRRTTKESVVQNLRSARSSVSIAMSEIGCTDVLEEVITTKGRGVEVRVLLDPQDMREYLPRAIGFMGPGLPKGALNALALKTLLEAGIDVRLFTVGKEFALLHLKMAVFDATRAIVGSTNWTRGGFEWVNETDVELHDGPVIEELLAQFALDWDRAVPAAMPSPFVQGLCHLYQRFVQ
jgi:phosphatidylserine/phosphatidylglycerophosphate/cardiolipin synthase-like enzyme